MYVRVIGHLRGSHGGKQIAAFAVRYFIYIHYFHATNYYYVDILWI